jgi:hypothetical protein
VREIFSKRKRAAEEAAARAKGELVDYLIREAPDEFRFQVWYSVERGATSPSVYGDTTGPPVLSWLHRHLLDEYGYGRLSPSYRGSDWKVDLRAFVLQDATTQQLMDVVDAAPLAFEAVFDRSEAVTRSLEFYETVRRRMREHKLAYDIAEFQVVEKDAEELHQEVVGPALTLLHGRKRFSQAEKQYRAALDELAQANWADAITDANAAVEVVLRTILGYEQGQLPSLLHEGRKRGLFGDPQESRLRKVVEGFTALADVRDKESDAHGKDTDRATAWLAVHWAGALVLYLVEQAEARGL